MGNEFEKDEKLNNEELEKQVEVTEEMPEKEDYEAELKKIINEMEGCTIALDTGRLTPLAKRYLSHLENLNAVKCYPWATERYYIWLYKNIAFECKFFGIARASR